MWRLGFMRRYTLIMVYQEKLPHPLPVSIREPPDVLLLQRTIKSLEQENAWLKEQLAHILRDKAASTR
jgi:hypothetical protein